MLSPPTEAGLWLVPEHETHTRARIRTPPSLIPAGSVSREEWLAGRREGARGAAFAWAVLRHRLRGLETRRPAGEVQRVAADGWSLVLAGAFGADPARIAGPLAELDIAGADVAFVAIEGNSGVGKTTLSRALAHPDAPLPEYGDYIAQDPELRLPPSVSTRPVADPGPWLDVDRLRTAQLRASRLPRIVDTTALSVIGYEHTRRALGLPHALRPLAGAFLDAFRSGELLQPSGWLFLAASDPTLHHRIAGTGGTRALLARTAAMQHLRAFRRRFAERYLVDGCWAELDNEDRPLSDLVRSARSAIAGFRCAAPRALEALCRDLLEEPE